MNSIYYIVNKYILILVLFLFCKTSKNRLYNILKKINKSNTKKIYTTEINCIFNFVLITIKYI